MGFIDSMIVECTNDSSFKYDHGNERVAKVRWKEHIHWPGLGNIWPGYGEILYLVRKTELAVWKKWPGFGKMTL